MNYGMVILPTFSKVTTKLSTNTKWLQFKQALDKKILNLNRERDTYHTSKNTKVLYSESYLRQGHQIKILTMIWVCSRRQKVAETNRLLSFTYNNHLKKTKIFYLLLFLPKVDKVIFASTHIKSKLFSIFCNVKHFVALQIE